MWLLISALFAITKKKKPEKNKNKNPNNYQQKTGQ